MGTTYKVQLEDNEPTSTPSDHSQTTPPEDDKKETTPAPSPDKTAKADPPAEPTIGEEQLTKIRQDVEKDVTGKVSKSVLEKLGDALGLTKKEEEELPTDPKQLKEYINSAVKEQFSAANQEAEKGEKQQAQERQERVTTIISGWHTQYERLAKLGKVPAIKDPNNDNDPGIIARKRAIKTIGQIIKESKDDNPNSDYVPSVSDVLVRYPNAIKGEIPGADLPIGGNSAVRESTGSYTYDDVHNRSFEEIAAEAS